MILHLLSADYRISIRLLDVSSDIAEGDARLLWCAQTSRPDTPPPDALKNKLDTPPSPRLLVTNIQFTCSLSLITSCRVLLPAFS